MDITAALLPFLLARLLAITRVRDYRFEPEMIPSIFGSLPRPRDLYATVLNLSAT